MRAYSIAIGIGLTCLAGAAIAGPGHFGLGTPVTPEQIRPWDIDVRPDGTGLPPGQGTVEKGEKIFAEQCSACHGDKGQTPAKGFDKLVGGKGTLATAKPVQTVGSYWPYATTIFDYVHRAMPFPSPQSLSNDEVYSVVAYLLYLNDIVPRDTVLNADALKKVKMPNADGFIPDGRPDTPELICKSDCK
ncbi:cytochrome c [Bradyrhizobium jicamae]|uniref:Cytochrome c n=1 Tax=Bradyrhizobium jicamae TaxID=280332 RepID=A0ABS5FT84_9BRAD|nr:cytochrome c [Bradyrhizobium jicamae]MBR0799945.1 cytochrome c [Bradyrhizobium jicamae]